MNHLPIIPRRLTWLLCGGVLSLSLLFADVAPACADDVQSSGMAVSTVSAPPLAAWYSELARRDRVVQICVLTGAAALFVIMKKLVR